MLCVVLQCLPSSFWLSNSMEFGFCCEFCSAWSNALAGPKYHVYKAAISKTCK
ncbi:hypothetical protein HanRHA438_Chr09g0399001 [Helianthus annuus]|nr:hypothetical protein HanRHA438_Chr09g0399001 [Helianthus annuus]